MTQEPPSAWARGVLRGVLRMLGELSVDSGIEVWVVAAWLEGETAHVVYRKTGMRGTFGYWFDTHEACVSVLWPKPEAVGEEYAILAIHEPHEDAPEYDIQQGRITWWTPPGQTEPGAVPAWPDAVPPAGAWTDIEP